MASEPPPPYEAYEPSSYAPTTAAAAPTVQLRRGPPPPLPPRASSSTTFPAPGLSSAPDPPAGLYLNADPRSSSTQSLVPPSEKSIPPASSSTVNSPSTETRRTLLLVYIHGFQGSDQSFRSFPAHVHNLLSTLLVNSHAVHSKIYPRYKTYRALDVARDKFSAWLEPHEGPNTDVILVGHSMGGILAAEVILMPSPNQQGQQHLSKHRILGHVSLDAPLLGLHPGIIVSGLSSLFKPGPQAPEDASDRTETPSSINNDSPTSSPPLSTASMSEEDVAIAASLLAPPRGNTFLSQPRDPLYNPPFFNDDSFPEQPFVRRMLHFANKYRSDGLFQSMTKHVFDYLEYGGSLADPAELESRYARLRALEEIDELQSFEDDEHHHGPTARVRFANYYTLCTGRPKPAKKGKSGDSTGAESSSTPRDGSESTLPEASTEPRGPLQTELSSEIPAQVNDEAADAHQLASPEKNIDAEATKSTSTLALASSKETGSSVADLQQPEHSVVPSLSSIQLTQTRRSMQSDESSFVDALSTLTAIDPVPIEDDKDGSVDGGDTKNDEPITSTNADDDIDTEINNLPPIPDSPRPPTPLDLDALTDKDARKQAEREARRRQRAYEHAVKDRDKAVREREKLIEKMRHRRRKATEKLERDALKEEGKRQKEATREAARQEKAALKEQQRLEKEEAKRRKQEVQTPKPSDLPSQEQEQLQSQSQRDLADAAVARESGTSTPNKPQKLRKFCMLPRKDQNGVRDQTWVDVFMPDVDEVSAHTGLFFPWPHYDKLVGDVAHRIASWVQDDMTRKTILEMRTR